MKIATFLSLATFAYQVSQTAADSVCSSGLYAALAPLDNYPPAVSYCQGQAGKATITVTVGAAKIKRVPVPVPTKATTTTTLKTTTTTTSKDAKASSWSSLVQQAQSIIATFCSCAGYPATKTITMTSAPKSTCSYGTSAGQPCHPSSLNFGSIPSSDCDSDCSTLDNSGQGCTSDTIDSNSNCILYINCCTQY